MNRLQHLQKVIDTADVAYYTTGTPVLTDAQYDALKDELAALAPGDVRNARFGPPELPTALRKTKHLCFMGSLFKADDEAALRRWHADMVARLPDGLLPENLARRSRINASLKADGASVALYYMGGRLAHAVTRGGDDGIGEDITANAIWFAGVPTQLPTAANVAVRGEVVLTVEKWKEVDPQGSGNPRNLGNGIMRRLDGVNSDKLTFIAFDVEAMQYTFPDEVITEFDKQRLLVNMGFNVVPYATFAGVNDVLAWHADAALSRATLPFWIDGVVFKMNDLALQREAGVRDNRPRGQVVLKFEAEGAVTTLLDVALTVGHTGAIIPTGKVRPVRIGGTTVSSVLLNNFQMITDLDLAVGDTVRVIKAKDIIPQVAAVVDRPAERKAIAEPAACPVCGGPAGRRDVGGVEGSGAVTECKSDACPAKSVARVKTWIKKLDIQGIGDELLAALTSPGCPSGQVRTPADLYRLAAEPVRVAFLPGVKVGAGKLGLKRAAAVLKQIGAKRELPTHMFMGSLGIPHLGRRRAELIMDALPGQFDTVADWLDTEKLIAGAAAAGIPNIATEIAAGILAFKDHIEDLLNFVKVSKPAIKLKEDVPPASGGEAGKLAGYVICFTGKIEKCDTSGKRYTRAMMQQLVVENGGQASDDVTAGVTTHLVQADVESVSSKSTKAKKLGVQLLSEAAFFALVEA